MEPLRSRRGTCARPMEAARDASGPSTMSTRASTPATTGSRSGRRLDRVAPVRAGAGAVRVDPVDGRRQGFHRNRMNTVSFPRCSPSTPKNGRRCWKLKGAALTQCPRDLTGSAPYAAAEELPPIRQPSTGDSHECAQSAETAARPA